MGNITNITNIKVPPLPQSSCSVRGLLAKAVIYKTTPTKDRLSLSIPLQEQSKQLAVSHQRHGFLKLGMQSFLDLPARGMQYLSKSKKIVLIGPHYPVFLDLATLQNTLFCKVFD